MYKLKKTLYQNVVYYITMNNITNIFLSSGSHCSDKQRINLTFKIITTIFFVMRFNSWQNMLKRSDNAI